MSVKTKASLENLVESGVLGVESLHPGGMTTTKELAELCRVSENKLLLDVASGTGESTCFLVGEFGCTAMGIDASEIMVKQAKEKAANKGYHIDYQLGDAHDLPFDDNYFDVVISECTTCALDKERAIAEMVRVTKSGGYVGIQDICWKSSTPEKLKARLEEIEGERPETLEGWVMLFQQAGLVECEGIDCSELIPTWIKLSKRDLGLKGQWNIVKTAVKNWGLKGLMTILASQRIFTSRHTGYGIIVGHKS